MLKLFGAFFRVQWLAQQIKRGVSHRERRSELVRDILDEVGQYVAASDDRILNLQGLAENLKKIGRGRAWLVATAQQTLTEDDPRAATNTAKLFKLKDRFPIRISWESRKPEMTRRLSLR